MTQNDNYMGDLYQLHQDHELISKETKKRIFIAVLVGHLLLIVAPLIFLAITRWLKPKRPRVIKIKMVQLPPQAPRDKTEDLVKQLKQLSPPPQPEPKKPEPKKEVKKPKKPEPKKEVKKPVKKPAKEIAKKPVKPKKTWLSPKDIIVSQKTVEVNNPQYKPLPKLSKLKASDFKSRLKETMQFTSVEMPDVKTSPTYSPRQVADYYDNVASYLYRMWDQPTDAQLGGRKPEVLVQVSVDDHGNIKSSKIVDASGIAIMDASVKALLGKVSKLPAPPGGAMTFNINLKIID